MKLLYRYSTSTGNCSWCAFLLRTNQISFWIRSSSAMSLTDTLPGITTSPRPNSSVGQAYCVGRVASAFVSRVAKNSKDLLLSKYGARKDVIDESATRGSAVSGLRRPAQRETLGKLPKVRSLCRAHLSPSTHTCFSFLRPALCFLMVYAFACSGQIAPCVLITVPFALGIISSVLSRENQEDPHNCCRKPLPLAGSTTESLRLSEL